MPLQYTNLDEKTRPFMVAELERDNAQGTLYLSPRLTANGQNVWLELLREAASAQDDAWLADRLRVDGLLLTHEQRRKPKGGYTTAKVPHTAADTLSEGEFNRLYARGLCARAIEEGVEHVVVYHREAGQWS